MGVGPWLVEKAAEGNARSDIQRPERHDCGQADVPRFLQAAALPHTGVGLLRVGGDAGGKQPYYFSRRDGQVITIAGVQDGWTEPQSGERLRSCSMVITEANKFVSDIHDRMPVILEAEHFEQWMDGNPNDAAALMKPANEELLQKWPVSRRVNSSRADDGDATLIEKIDL
jgi:putative SOS response-associated peptidase YedK